MHLKDLLVTCTCVRVPVARSHSISVTVVTENKLEIEDVKKALDELGFNLLAIYKGDTFEKPDEKTERIVYISEKRNK